MTRRSIKILGIIASVSLFAACISLDSNTTRDGTPCTRDSEDDDCSRYVQYRNLERGFKDEGFDEAHRKQGYENLRERRREQREGRPNTNPFAGGIPAPPSTTAPDT